MFSTITPGIVNVVTGFSVKPVVIVLVVFVIALLGVLCAAQWEKRRARKHMAGRDPLTDAEFGARFFPPDQAHIAAEIRGILARHIPVDLSRLHASDEPIAHLRMLGIDSMSAVELLCDIEDEFNIKFSEEEAVRLRTVEDLVRAVCMKLSETRSEARSP